MMHNSNGVRKATGGDLDWILQELEQFAQSTKTKYSLFAPQEEVRHKIILNIIENHVFFVAEKERGMAAGFIVPHIFNPEILVLYEAFWWVSLDHRKSRAGLKLLNEFVKWGKENVDWIIFGLQNNSGVNDKTLFKRGFRVQERQYLMEI